MPPVGRPRRGATVDGSRGFQPTEWGTPQGLRRGATVEGVAIGMLGFMRRSATLGICVYKDRGLKPTATILWSLRDRFPR